MIVNTYISSGIYINTYPQIHTYFLSYTIWLGEIVCNSVLDLCTFIEGTSFAARARNSRSIIARVCAYADGPVRLLRAGTMATDRQKIINAAV